jgi:O-antigen ligase
MNRNHLTLTRLFAAGQLLCLILIPIFSPHSWRHILWQTPAKGVYVDFRSISLYLADIPLLGVFCFSLLILLFDQPTCQRYARLGWELIRHQEAFWWLGLIPWMAASLFWADVPRLTLYQTLHFALSLGMAFLIADTLQRIHPPSVWIPLLLAAAGQALLAIGQLYSGGVVGLDWLGELTWNPQNLFDLQQPHLRGYGLAVHPNNLAGFLLIALFAGVMLLRSQKRFLIPLLMLTIITALGLLATLSRGAIIAASIGLTISLVFFPPAKIPPRNLVLVSLSLLLALALVLTSRPARDSAQRLVDPSGIQGRLTEDFADTNRLIHQNPFLGTGAGNLLIESAQLRATNNPLTLLPPHNVYWFIWGELGLGGLLLFLFGIFSIIRVLHPQNGMEVFIWGCCWLAICLVMGIDFYFWGDARSRLLLCWVLGMIWGCRLQFSANRAILPATQFNLRTTA